MENKISNSKIKLNLNDLPNLLFNNKENKENLDNIDNPCIIYMGVGTHFYSNENKNSWKHHENQQFPPFIHDFKINNIHIPIKIILIDSAFNDTIPYIVADNTNFLSDTWINDKHFSNVYHSEYNLSVYVFSTNIYWGNTYSSKSDELDIINLLVDICLNTISSNILFFYHEFTGNNPELLEFEIKKKIQINSNKICIDISRGTDHGCYINLCDPINYPLIIYLDNKLSYLNPSLIDYDDKISIINNIANITNIENIENIEIVSNNKEQYDYILYKQIINQDNLYLKKCKNLFIPLFRQFYYFKTINYEYVNSYIKYLHLLIIDIPNTITYYIKLQEYYNQLTNILSIKTEYFEPNDLIDYLIKNIFINIKELFKLCLLSINSKFYKEEQLILLLNEFDKIHDKYKLQNIFNIYCK
jgi:hypothetical protein